MPRQLTRRQFLRSAGGVTFLALSPVGRGLFAATTTAAQPAALPLFTALPYIQPGPEGRLVPDAEIVRLAWQTEPKSADFAVEFGRDTTYGRTAAITRTQRDYSAGQGTNGRFNYVCAFDGLALGTEYRYRVRGNGAVIAEGYFTTRQPRGHRIRFASFGDNAIGSPGECAIAFHAYQAHPDFIMNTGDNVYENGLDDEYRKYFFPIYNADTASLQTGAPLLRSVPFLTVMANHDINGTEPGTGFHCANFDANPDALGYYTNFHLPLNGPAAPASPTYVHGAPARLADFRACAGDRFPRMANYAFDCGDAHFLCLDSNLYLDPTDAALQAWIAADLASTDARWKIVVFHHPAFNVGANHYTHQQMRALVPLLEKHGVDLVLSGHEHTYQRTRPLRFAPRDQAKAAHLHEADRRIPGDFTVDQKFDGITATRADGIIHITTGAGGQKLYDPGFTDAPEKWLHADDDNLAYAVKVVSDRYSLSIIELDAHELTLRQVDDTGAERDQFRMTKT